MGLRLRSRSKQREEGGRDVRVTRDEDNRDYPRVVLKNLKKKKNSLEYLNLFRVF